MILRDSSIALHYRDQRDALYTFLVDEIGIPKTKIAEILGISKEAVSQQFPRSKKKKTNK